MANLDDLDYKSITEMQNDEALELLRQIRLSRRTPIKPTNPTKTQKKPSTKVDSNQAAELLKILMGDK